MDCLYWSAERMLDPPGPLPNDLINGFSVAHQGIQETTDMFAFELSVNSVWGTGKTLSGAVVVVRILASSVHLEDPNKPTGDSGLSA
jgi:hypothetical protein